MKLWSRDAKGREWKAERDVTEDTAERWLEVFRKDHPDKRFRVSEKKPKPHGPEVDLSKEDASMDKTYAAAIKRLETAQEDHGKNVVALIGQIFMIAGRTMENHTAHTTHIPLKRCTPVNLKAFKSILELNGWTTMHFVKYRGLSGQDWSLALSTVEPDTSGFNFVMVHSEDLMATLETVLPTGEEIRRAGGLK